MAGTGRARERAGMRWRSTLSWALCAVSLSLAVSIALSGCEAQATSSSSTWALKAPRAETDEPPAVAPEPWRARLPDGRVVSVRYLDEPGESELWMSGANGEGVALAPAPGADEQPTVLPDGRVLFVSGRSGVMSVWIADAKTGAVVQRTNVGLVTGGSRKGFVPPPVGPIAIADGRASWDDGYGARWSIALAGEE